MRPTVATTTWAPERSCDCCERIGAPPKTATISMSRCSAKVRSAWVTWMQSSRVGVRTIACTSSFVGVEVLQQRQPEGSGLAGPGLRLADHVVAGEQLRDRLFLDRRRLVEAELVDRLLDVGGKPEVFECGHCGEQSRRAGR